MNDFIERKKKSILGKSESKNYYAALTEWEVLPEFDIEENFKDRPNCELCGKDKLKYLHWIVNTMNLNKILVGSTCINHFLKLNIKISYIDPLDNVRKYFESKNDIDKYSINSSLIKAINNLKNNKTSSEWVDVAVNVLEKVKSGEKISPRQAGVVFRNIEIDECKYVAYGLRGKINLSKSKNKSQILDFNTNPNDQINGLILKSLTSRQRKWLKEQS